MTTMEEKQSLRLVSSTTPQELWGHPTLDLFNLAVEERRPQVALLYRSPSLFGEPFDDDDRPRPTSAIELPDIAQWSMSFTINLLEIIAGRRQPAQLATRCHHVIYRQLLAMVGCEKEIGRIRKIHQDQPLDGICESVITVRFGERVRALAIRTEGVDGRWLCTALRLM
jgi:hypothetical protein